MRGSHSAHREFVAAWKWIDAVRWRHPVHQGLSLVRHRLARAWWGSGCRHGRRQCSKSCCAVLFCSVVHILEHASLCHILKQPGMHARAEMAAPPGAAGERASQHAIVAPLIPSWTLQLGLMLQRDAAVTVYCRAGRRCIAVAASWAPGVWGHRARNTRRVEAWACSVGTCTKIRYFFGLRGRDQCGGLPIQSRSGGTRSDGVGESTARVILSDLNNSG